MDDWVVPTAIAGWKQNGICFDGQILKGALKAAFKGTYKGTFKAGASSREMTSSLRLARLGNETWRVEAWKLEEENKSITSKRDGRPSRQEEMALWWWWWVVVVGGSEAFLSALWCLYEC